MTFYEIAKYVDVTVIFALIILLSAVGIFRLFTEAMRTIRNTMRSRKNRDVF